MADLALIAIMAIWGSSFALLRFFFGGGQGPGLASPLLLLAVRMGLASALLFLWVAASAAGRGHLRALVSRGALARGSLLRDGLLCGALLAGGFLLQSEGLQRTTASRSGFFTGLLVVLTPLCELLIFGKRPGPASLAGILLAFAGMALLAGGMGPDGPIPGATALGDALTVGCALIFSLHILALGRATRRQPVLPLLLVQLASVAAAAALVGPLVEPGHLAPDLRLWSAIVFLALFATLLCLGIQTWAQRKVSAVRMALLSSLEPVFAALWAALLLGERLTAHEKLGGALIVLGVAVGEAGAAFLARARAAS